MSVWDIPGASHRIEEKVLKRCRVDLIHGKNPMKIFGETLKESRVIMDGGFGYGVLEWIDS